MACAGLILLAVAAVLLGHLVGGLVGVIVALCLVGAFCIWVEGA